MNTVISKDGTKIAYVTRGSGPSLLIIPGALAVAESFTTLAEELEKNFTVHTVERRGRGESDPQGVGYSIEKECEDIDAVQTQTGATFMFGHSFGGFAALEAARNNPQFKKVAVYEPGVSIDGSINLDWIPRARQELNAHNYHAAFVTFVRALSPESASTPRPMLSLILRMVIKKQEREQKYQLLEAAVHEHLEEGRLNNTYSHYSEITADVLLMRGEKGVVSNSVTEKLLSVLPSAHDMIFPGLNHLAPEDKPAQIAGKIIAFFNQANA